MRMTVDRAAFVSALSQVASTSKKTASNITRYALLSVDDGSVKICATDLETYHETVIPCECKGVDAVAVETKKLLDVVKAANSETIRIDFNAGHKIKVHSEAGVFTIGGLDPMEYPQRQAVDTIATATVDATALNAAFKVGLACVKRSGSGEILEGVLIEIGPTGMNVVAIDGVKLAMVPMACEADEDTSAVIPATAVADIVKAGHSGPVSLSVGETSISFQFAGGTLITTSVMAGDYPDYRQVIPTGGDVAVSADVGDIKSAIAAISAVAEDHVIAAKVEVTENDVKMSIVGESSDGEVSVRCTVDKCPESMEIGISHSNLSDVMRVCSGIVKMEFSGPIAPVKITTDGGATLLVMPMRLN